MTPFSLLLQGCGLSQREAATVLSVSIHTVKSWGSGRNPTPAGVLAELQALAQRQQTAAREAHDVWQRAGAPDSVEIGYCSDDSEAQSLGWPCVGAHGAVIRRMIEMLPPSVTVHLAPRGSTVATAAAAEAHGR